MQQRAEGFRLKKFDFSKLLYLFRVLVHPLSAFNDLKYEKKSSMLLANIMVVLFFIVNIFGQSSTGYIFSSNAAEDINLWATLASTVGVLVLWTVCNWATCTLLDGEGKMSEIWTVTAYSLLPWILLGSISIVLTNVFSIDETIMINSIQFIYQGWTFILIFLGVLTVHQYTVKKTILSAIFAVLSMLAVCFLILLFFSIAQQIFTFATGIFKEIMMR
ncbi:MAG: Yip1 family protein [Oscillospiraceae bacterium]